MKRISALLPALLLAAAAPVLAEPVQSYSGGEGPGRPLIGVEARVGGVAWDKDCWDDSAGFAADIGLSVWEPSGVLGVWLGLGGQTASYRWEDDWGPVESDVAAVPFGASLLARFGIAPGLSLRAEAGARYVSMDIDDWDDDYHHHRRWRGERDRYLHPDRYLDVDDTSLAVVALQLEFDLDPVWIAVGGGYQFDLEKPDVEYLHEPIGEVDLSGALFFLDIGAVF